MICRKLKRSPCQLSLINPSNEIIRKIVDLKNKIYSVAGGGDTIALLNRTNSFKEFEFVSTAGGAFLEYLEGKEIPGIRALKS